MENNTVNEDMNNELVGLEANEGNHVHDGHGSEVSMGSHKKPEETVSEEDSNETFDRKYVEKLRKESAKYRERAGKADELSQRLHAALVAADGRLADPSDLEFNETHLEDPEALAAAVADLIGRKPGLRAQQLGGDVGAGKRGSTPKPPMDLLSIMRGM